MFRRNLCLVLSLLVMALVVTPAFAQQPNSPGASLRFAGFDPGTYPIVAPINAAIFNAGIMMEIEGAPNQPFALVVSPDVRSTGGNTIFGLLDVDMNGLYVLMDGIGLPVFSAAPFLDFFARTDASGRWALPLPTSPSSAGFCGAFQALVADPTAQFGFTLTAATKLQTTYVPMDAVYVSESLGDPANDGSAASPLSLVSDAMAMAVAIGNNTGTFPEVIVEQGTYVEPSDVFLHESVDVSGGFQSIIWSKVPGARSTVCLGAHTSVRASDIDLPTVVRDMVFKVDDAVSAGAPSIAADIRNCDVDLKFENCCFIAGRGADGANGPNGVNEGTDGSNGANGISAGSFGSSSPGGLGGGGVGGRHGGRGGDGAAGQPAGSGNSGASGAGGGGGGGSAGGGASCGGTAGSGSNGSTGADGAGGAGGVAQNLGGFADSNGNWQPGVGAAGQSGFTGFGGGGGGGGGSVPDAISFCIVVLVGGGGGGGGGGAGGGARGHGGQNGGGSLAVYLFNSSPTFDACTFMTNNGGDGGDGGDARKGGEGGSRGLRAVGGSGPTSTGTSGNGGHGGHGGDGGGGGGGAAGHGGPSYGLFRAGTSTPTLVGNNDFTGIGSGGTAGFRGLRGLGGDNATNNAGTNGGFAQSGPSGSMN